MENNKILTIEIMRSLIAIVKKFAASAKKVRHINIALFGLVLLLSGIAIGHTSAPKFVQEVWAAVIGGGGTVSKVAAFTGTDTIGDSMITQDSPSSVTIGVVSPRTAVDLTVTGNLSVLKGLASNGNMTISSNAITTETGDFTIGAKNPGKLILQGSEVTANGVHLGLINGRSGVLTAAIKNFVIDHPLKPGYELVHSSLEGPEIGVFYRGTAKLMNGRATVALPDYFDALTRDRTATVLLTAKGETPFLLSYDRFDEKSFVVHGAKADGEFDWEVKATRQDVPPLEIERKK